MSLSVEWSWQCLLSLTLGRGGRGSGGPYHFRKPRDKEEKAVSLLLCGSQLKGVYLALTCNSICRSLDRFIHEKTTQQSQSPFPRRQTSSLRLTTP